MKDREKRLRGVERQRQERLQPKLPAGGKKLSSTFLKSCSESEILQGAARSAVRSPLPNEEGLFPG